MGYLDNDGLAHLWDKIKDYVSEHGGGSSAIVQWEDINGRPDLTKFSSMIVAPIVLVSSAWVSNQQIIPIEGILANETAQIIIPIPAQANKDAYKAAGIEAVSQSENSITFQTTSVPESDLNVNVYIFGAAEVKPEYSGVFEWWSPKMTSNNAPSPYVCSASSNKPSYGSSGIYAAFDGTNDTYWACDNSDSNIYIKIDFGNKINIFGIKLFPRHDYAYKQLPVTFSISLSDDNTTWRTVYQQTNGVQVASKDAVKTIRFDTIYNCRYIKIDRMAGTYVDGPRYVSIGDIQFYKFVPRGGVT